MTDKPEIDFIEGPAPVELVITDLVVGEGTEAKPGDQVLVHYVGVDFETGDPVERAAFFASFPDEQKSNVGEEMGVQLYGGRLAADPTKGLVTNIDGVYAIGDANSDNVTNVPHALFSGKRTAVYVHGKLNLLVECAEKDC